MENMLSYKQVELLALNATHYDALAALAQDPAIWRYNPSFNHPSEFKSSWYEKALSQIEQGKRFVYVIAQQEQLVGSSSYYDLNVEPLQLSIGYTWFNPQFQGQGLNLISKYLLLHQAFENLGIQQVNFAADSINTKSIRALMALGAVQGKTIIRHIQRPDGSWRDTIQFHISEQAWPLIKRQIEAKIR